MSSKALIFVFLLFARFADAQLSVDWYKNSGELNIYNPKKSVYNSADSCIYSVGMFSGQFEMDGALISSNYLKSFFLMKTSGNGELIWLKKIAENDYWVELPSMLALTTDNAGDLILGITFNRKLFFGSDSIVLPDDPITTGGLLIKMDTSGTQIWHKQIYESSIECVATNGSNEVFVTGRTAVNDDAYLSAYSETGDSLWTRTGGSSSGYDEGLMISFDALDNIYLGGRFEPNSAVYFNTEHPTFVSPYFGGCFLAKYDVTGGIQWLRCFYTSNFPNYIFYRSISIQNEKVIVAGSFEGGTAKFYPSSSALSSGSNLNTSFIVCYDTIGNLLWKNAPHESLSGATGLDLGVSLNGMIVYKGTFSGSFVTAGDTLLSVNNDLFLEVFDTLGNSVWHKQINGSNSDGAMSFFKAGEDLIMNISTKSNSLQLDNTTLSLAPVTDQMVLVRFNYETIGLLEKETTDFSLYPNPNNGSWYLRSSKDINGKKMQIVSLTGALVFEQRLSNAYQNEMSANLPSGVYLVCIEGSFDQPLRMIVK